MILAFRTSGLPGRAADEGSRTASSARAGEGPAVNLPSGQDAHTASPRQPSGPPVSAPPPPPPGSNGVFSGLRPGALGALVSSTQVSPTVSSLPWLPPLSLPSSTIVLLAVPSSLAVSLGTFYLEIHKHLQKQTLSTTASYFPPKPHRPHVHFFLLLAQGPTMCPGGQEQTWDGPGLLFLSDTASSVSRPRGTSSATSPAP